jgi:SAM-dependent methyltransferase
MEPVTGQLQREHSARAARTYAAAADNYMRPALGFWDRWGTATVARLPLSSGDAVLDVCCGAGASALPAARAVAPAGNVLGLDLAQPLLALAGQRAANLGLTNVSFRECDATASGLQSSSFDAVVCVFGVFFAADMPAFVAEMTGANRHRASSGARFESSRRRFSGRSTHGTRSPRRPRCPTCSRAAVSHTRRSRPPPASTTNSNGLTTSGTSCSDRATAPPSRRSTTSSAHGFVSA